MAAKSAESNDIAGEILLFLAGRPDLMAAFMDLSGLSVAEVAALARKGRALGPLLDFLAEEDARLLACADALGLPAQHLMKLRTELAGPGSFGWSVD